MDQGLKRALGKTQVASAIKAFCGKNKRQKKKENPLVWVLSFSPGAGAERVLLMGGPLQSGSGYGRSAVDVPSKHWSSLQRLGDSFSIACGP